MEFELYLARLSCNFCENWPCSTCGMQSARLGDTVTTVSASAIVEGMQRLVIL